MSNPQALSVFLRRAAGSCTRSPFRSQTLERCSPQFTSSRLRCLSTGVPLKNASGAPGPAGGAHSQKQSGVPRKHELGVGEMEGITFKVEPIKRTGEDVSTMRARLLCMFSSLSLRGGWGILQRWK